MRGLERTAVDLVTLQDRSEPLSSIVVPIHNEGSHITPLLGEIETAMRAAGAYEVICVDDGSTDDTAAELSRFAEGRSWFRSVQHGTRCGKSAALLTGVRAARAPVIVTIDGDGQNDPAVIPRMIAELSEAGSGCGLVAGQRLGRHDAAQKRLRSKIANSIRAALLDDGTRDSNCGLKCFPRAVFLDLPFFDGLHRYLPALVRCDGYAISLIDVIDRPRLSSRPDEGLFDRFWGGMADLVGVIWLVHRRRLPVASSHHPDHEDDPAAVAKERIRTHS